VKGALEIDLLMVDAVMPEMSGPELAEVLLFLRPLMKVLFITGLDGLTMRLAFDRPCVCVQKPFTLRSLAPKIKELLEGAEEHPGSP
jgi:two-component system cell cycle sensor histidine kinase/response regulator CckA